MTADLTGRSTVLPWPPAGVADFADVAWAVAEALGNADGIRSMRIGLRADGGATCDLSVERQAFVERLGKDLPGFSGVVSVGGATLTHGMVAGVRVYVTHVGDGDGG